MAIRKISLHLLGITTLLAAGSAQAETVIKRLKCADYSSSGNGYIAISNYASTAVSFDVQIVRDGCRPKPDAAAATYRALWFNAAAQVRNAIFVRQHKGTDRVSGDLGTGQLLRIYFQSLTTEARGTFDLSVDFH